MPPTEITVENLLKRYKEDKNCYETENSDVAAFFAGKHVFITGGTGFLGKLTIEKLLRSCPDVAGIFMLVRSKKGKDMHTRFDEIFNGRIYEILAKRQPKFRHKIIPVSGDCGLPGLGLRIEDRKVLTEKVSVIFHAAATVRFDEKINVATNINIKGTSEVLALAREIKNLCSMVHVSTAFSPCQYSKVEETFYENSLSPEQLCKICDSVPLEILAKITPDLIEKHPNTYSFTKALAEEVIRKNSQGLPVCVFRPSIVISTRYEPLQAWIDNFYGPTGMFTGVGVGLIRTIQVDKTVNADIVPADMVVSCMIAAAYQTARKKEETTPIYNYVCSTQKPITWGTYAYYAKFYGLRIGTTKAIWRTTAKLVPNLKLYLLYAFLVHTIPALVADFIAVIIGKKPQLLKAYKKIHKFNNVISFFASREWIFTSDNVQNLYKSLSEADQKLFNFDMSQMDWDTYFSVYPFGIREFIVKDPLSTIPEGIKRFNRLKYMHYTFLTVLYLVGLRILYAILCFIYNFCTIN